MITVKAVDVVGGAVSCYITIQVILLVVEVLLAENYREGVSVLGSEWMVEVRRGSFGRMGMCVVARIVGSDWLVRSGSIGGRWEVEVEVRAKVLGIGVGLERLVHCRMVLYWAYGTREVCR